LLEPPALAFDAQPLIEAAHDVIDETVGDPSIERLLTERLARYRDGGRG
jgi:hypothetical protein